MLKQSISVDDYAEARVEAQRSRRVLSMVKPYSDIVQGELINRICQSSRDPSLTNDQLRSMVGELAGIQLLLSKIDSIAQQAEAKIGA